MKIAVISKSDSIGGAAIVSRRLTEALLQQGAEATMVVADKRTDFPWVQEVRSRLKTAVFVADRLPVMLGNGFSRKNLWKCDAGSFGLPLLKHPAVKEADAVILNWINQGMLSLKGLRQLAASGKKILWIMHDMWPMTGVCHHAMDCRRYTGECGFCPLLGRFAGADDLSHNTWLVKKEIYSGGDFTFVAVSHWLADCAQRSSLLRGQKLEVVPNAFQPVGNINRLLSEGKRRVLFAAASLDNWIKGLDVFLEAWRLLEQRNPELAADCEPAFMGAAKHPERLPGRYYGIITDEKELALIYAESEVVANCSDFENLPGTLIEGQAYGAIPVAFDKGGQRDIISHLSTGYLASWKEDPAARAEAIANGIEWALTLPEEEKRQMRLRMRRSVDEKFSYPAVASKILSLIG